MNIPMDKNKKTIIIGLILLALAGGAFYYFFMQKDASKQLAAIREKTEKFINENMLAAGSDGKITEMVEESGLYKITVDVKGQNLTAYISKDGKNFFPQIYSMEDDAPGATPEKSVTKTDVPDVELFVMSYCPYGLQMEKGILPVLELFGSKINYSLKFVDYVMHGEKELQENMRQYCIGFQGASQLNNYLSCFAKQGDYAVCLKEAKIISAQLASCVSATDAQFKITEKFKDKNQWNNSQYPPFDIFKADNAKYDVGGSPTLVIKGQSVPADRDPQSLLNLICSAFSNQPQEGSQKLSGDTPSAGFGEGTTSGSSTNSDCVDTE